MKRLFLFSFFIFNTSIAQIWEPVIESDQNAIYSYDRTSIKRDGDMVTYWELSDYATPLKSGGLVVTSSKSKIIQDCKNNRYKVGDLIDYDGHGGTGNIVNVSMVTETNWYRGVSGSVNEVMRDKVCQ